MFLEFDNAHNAMKLEGILELWIVGVLGHGPLAIHLATHCPCRQ